MRKQDRMPDFFVSSLVDCLCESKVSPDNINKCLDWLINRVDTFTDSQTEEFVARASEVFKLDSDGTLCMMSGNMTPEERARWFRLYKKLQRLQKERKALYKHQLFQVA